MIKGKVSKGTLDRIIDRLATDDAFRDHLTRDPKTALAEYGLEVDASKLKSPLELASKEEIAGARDELHRKMQGNLGLIMFIA